MPLFILRMSKKTYPLHLFSVHALKESLRAHRDAKRTDITARATTANRRITCADLQYVDVTSDGSARKHVTRRFVAEPLTVSVQPQLSQGCGQHTRNVPSPPYLCVSFFFFCF